MNKTAQMNYKSKNQGRAIVDLTSHPPSTAASTNMQRLLMFSNYGEKRPEST